MEKKIVVTGRGTDHLFVTAVFTPKDGITEEQLKEFLEILKKRLVGLLQGLRSIGDLATNREDADVHLEAQRIVLALTYKHSGGYAQREKSWSVCEEWALADANDIITHLQEYLSIFET